MLLELRQNLEAVHARQVEIEEDDIRELSAISGIAEQTQRFLAVGHGRDANRKGQRAESLAHEFHVSGVVLDEKKLPFGRRAVPAYRSPRAAAPCVRI